MFRKSTRGRVPIGVIIAVGIVLAGAAMIWHDSRLMMAKVHRPVSEWEAMIGLSNEARGIAGEIDVFYRNYRETVTIYSPANPIPPEQIDSLEDWSTRIQAAVAAYTVHYRQAVKGFGDKIPPCFRLLDPTLLFPRAG